MQEENSNPRIVAGEVKNLINAGTLNVGHGMSLGATPTVQKTPRPVRALPSLTDIFVGRDRELADLRAYLQGPRKPGVTRELVIHGQRGIGKSSLAVTYAWRHIHDYPGGLYLVDCSSDDLQGAFASLLPDVSAGHGCDELDKALAANQVRSHIENAEGPALLI